MGIWMVVLFQIMGTTWGRPVLPPGMIHSDTLVQIWRPLIWQMWHGTVRIPQNLRERSKRSTTITSVPWYQNIWYQWANYTAGMMKRQNCYVCSRANPAQYVVPMPYNSSTCVQWRKERRGQCAQQCPSIVKTCSMGICSGIDPCYRKCIDNTPMCPYWCMLYQASSQYDQNKLASNCNYSRPWTMNKRSQTSTFEKLKVQEHLSYECFTRTGDLLVGHFSGNCAETWDVTPGQRYKTGTSPPDGALDAQTIPLADTWWLCGKEGGLRSTLPLSWTGTRTRVMLIQEVVVSPEVQFDALKQQILRQRKRKYEPDPTIQIDSIGQPKGIPNEFKARNEIAAGWEALTPIIGVSKNVEWINYIYYNQQRFINYTDDALEALGQQLDATSRVAWQNRRVLDWLLAEKGGVCVMFGEQCCTFIPNNTCLEGSFTRAMNKLKNLRKEVKQNAGFGHQFFD
ncbi:syncytin-B-like [Mobula hypostoma]|uniref:syncytin-B-like n=1 Tax=Mobula hypostoma TaxID=723540 RepID=UPI002FC372C1